MIRGSIAALVTPFDEEGKVDHKRLRELIDWHIEQKTDAVLVLGTTGETPALTDEEQEEIVKTAVDECRQDTSDRQQRQQQYRRVARKKHDISGAGRRCTSRYHAILQ